MSTALLLAAALLQEPGHAPAPLERGTLLLGGSGAVPEELAAAYLAAASGGEALLLAAADGVVAGAELGRPCAWPLDPAQRAAAGAVWLDDACLFEGTAGAELRTWLGEVLARGGVVGAGGAAAEALAGEAGVPGAGILVELERAVVLERLARAPGRAVLCLPPKAWAKLRGRELFLGAPEASVHVAGRDARALQGVWTEMYRRLDAVALARAALEAVAGEPLGEPRIDAGTLVLCGGGDVGGALASFVELAGGPDAPIVVVPASCLETLDENPPLVRAFARAGARNVAWIHARDRAEAEAGAELLAPFASARGVWLGSGRAQHLIERYERTPVVDELRRVLARGGVVGGSSAGAAVLAEVLARGGPGGPRAVLSAGYERGFGLLQGVALDTHVRERGRFPDLVALKRAHPSALVVGLDEGTWMRVRGTEALVLGAGEALFLDAESAPETPVGVATRVPAGRSYDLVLRRQVVLLGAEVAR
jgi:cyanophycinase